jgi:hypothetical protein
MPVLPEFVRRGRVRTDEDPTAMFDPYHVCGGQHAQRLADRGGPDVELACQLLDTGQLLAGT